MRVLKILAGGTVAYLILKRALRTMRVLGTRRFPNFVYSNVKVGELGVPVFTYHSIADPNTPDSITGVEFEYHMRYLANNGYHTLTADELYDHLVYGRPVPSKSVVITFDDGRASLWTVAFPILQKYNLKATCFIVPGVMAEAGVRPNLSDYECGKSVSLAQLLNEDLGEMPAITWQEAKLMHESGVIDFQSHTLDHTLVYYTPEIVDFVHPQFEFGYHNYEVPTISYDGIDYKHCRPKLGTPIYRHQSRMSSARRYFDDELLRNACIDYVKQHGHEDFFRRDNWRMDLFCFVEEYRQTHVLQDKIETIDEQKEAIHYSLAKSKEMIERQLSGHVVRHLCYPWHRYSALATYLAREVGYVTTFIDINPQKPRPVWNNPYLVQKTLPINEYGDDPYQITRIDAANSIVLSLPGQGRLTYPQRVAAILFRLPQLLGG